MVSLMTAMGLSLAAVATLYKSWRSHAPAVLYMGLALMVISAIAWSYSQGWEYGLVYALCLPGLLVWPFIAVNQVYLPDAKNRPPPRRIAVTTKRAVTHLSHALVVLAGLPVVSVLTAIAISMRIPTADTGQLATGIVLLPLIWGLLAYHYLATAAKTKAVLGYAALSVVSGLMLMYLPGLT